MAQIDGNETMVTNIVDLQEVIPQGRTTPEIFIHNNIGPEICFVLMHNLIWIWIKILYKVNIYNADNSSVAWCNNF